MTKASCRTDYLNRRLSLTDSERSRLDDLILIRFQQWQWPDHLTTVMSYWPLREKAEPNTFLITDFMEFRIPLLRLAYPLIDLQHPHMEAILVDEDTSYKKNKYGIAEPVEGSRLDPEEIDLVILPLLAFDKKGYRLGYGKGYYDRYLTHCREDCYKLGISYFEPMDQLPGLDPYDLPLNGCITPDAFYEF